MFLCFDLFVNGSKSLKNISTGIRRLDYQGRRWRMCDAPCAAMYRRAHGAYMPEMAGNARKLITFAHKYAEIRKKLLINSQEYGFSCRKMQDFVQLLLKI